MGANSHGQLGQGLTSEQCDEPFEIVSTWNNGTVQDIVCNGGHSLMIRDEGKLFACGWNHRRQLGFEIENCHTFNRVWDVSGIGFRKICAGWDSSAAISEKGVLYLWGSNVYGQLGLPCDNFPKSTRPIQLELKVRDVSMGMRHTVLLDVNGNVWTSGCGKRGQLGQGDNVTSLDKFQRIESISKIDKIACGQHHTLAWSKEHQTLYSWGDNGYGQLGIPVENFKMFEPTKSTVLQKYVREITQIYSGWTHSAVLLNSGKALYWGRNDYGQLGCEQLPEGCSFNVIEFKGHKIQQLALGSEHSVCLLNNNTVRAWGWNEHGNTGTGSTENIKEPKNVKMDIGNILKITSGAGHNFLISK